MTEEEIRKMANEFYEEFIKPMFPENITCPICTAENCSCNEHCINCGYKLLE